MSYILPDVALIILLGTGLLLLLGMFIAFVIIAYQQKQQSHQKEVSGLMEEYQKEILKAQLEMQEQTFLSISQEIHDNVGQILSLVRLHISTLPVTEVQAVNQKISDSKLLLDQAIGDLRNLSKKLNSQYVSRQSLSELMRFQLGLIQKTGTVETVFKVYGTERSFNPEKRLILFRIAQEALANAIRHAAATTISTFLHFAEENIIFTICDDGKGFIPVAHRAPKGTGTANMHYRANLIGADLQLYSSPGLGTQVKITLPY